MARFSYTTKDQTGTTQKGIVETTTITQATNLLHEKGYFIISLHEDTGSVIPQKYQKTKVNFSDIVHLTRQLSTMITAGLTLVEALHILQGQTKKPALTKLVAEMEEEVQGGKSFASVLEKYGNIFPPIYLALVKAGEASGKLDLILGRLADNLEKSKDFTSKVRGALVYPAIIVTGMGIVSTIVMIVVVPRLTSLYKEFGVTLPLPTQILIGLSNFLIHQWIVLVIAIVAFSAFFMKWKKTWFGRHMIATASLNMPIFGSLIKEATLVEVTRTLAILIDSGIPILTALEISRDATGNVLFKEAFLAASAKVEKGFPLSEPLVENRLFPPILGQMVAVGEQTGKLGDSLLKLSRYFETEADTAVRSLTTLIEPLIMVVLGLGVGFLVMAVLLPIYSLTSKF
jgi:type IV pilus assembly protein PilC